MNTCGALLARDHHRIHFAAADGAERFLRVGQAGAELGEFAGRRGAGGVLSRGQFSKCGFAFGVQIQPDKQAGGVRQVADEPAHRPGEFPDERRGRDDLAVARQDGLLIDVNHFQFAVALEFGFAQLRARRMAWRDRSVAPATYSRRTYLPVGRVARAFSKALVARLVLFVFTGVRLG